MAVDDLVPIDYEYLPLEEVIDRLKAEFNYAFVDKDSGTKSCEAAITRKKQWLEKGMNPHGAPIENQIAYWEELKGKVYVIAIADSEPPCDAVLSTLLLPDCPISFGYSSRSERQACRPLLERCARILGYEIEEL